MKRGMQAGKDSKTFVPDVYVHNFKVSITFNNIEPRHHY
jgi:hypothetical protein